MNQCILFNEKETIERLRHYLPTQAPLKDFVHHNTLHAFQSSNFLRALKDASELFGYKTSLTINEFRSLHYEGVIHEQYLRRAFNEASANGLIFEDLLAKDFSKSVEPKIGKLRKKWKTSRKIDLDTISHFSLFRILSAYLDQGISVKKMPLNDDGLLESVIEIENNSYYSLFKSRRVKALLFEKDKSLSKLLNILVGNEELFERYLFDQQFSHPGWSGMVAFLEENPKALFDERKISLFDLLYLELLIEIDALDRNQGTNWQPIGIDFEDSRTVLFDSSEWNEHDQALKIWQEAYEWSYHDQVLKGLSIKQKKDEEVAKFQAFFCIDDREESIRRHIEKLDPNCATYGTPAHFGLQVLFKPYGGNFLTQICPGVLNPTKVVEERIDAKKKKTMKDFHFHKHSHNGLVGALMAPSFGFWSAFKLFANIFNPQESAAGSSSMEHMNVLADLSIVSEGKVDKNGHSIGFTFDEMANVVEKELSSCGLKKEFAPIVYLFGHGGSSTNNPYYAGYNCGACSGRPSSVNSRVFAEMANNSEVRSQLENRGIFIPVNTQFLGGLHDTTKDEFYFFDEEKLSDHNARMHEKNKKTFELALANNAKERARQFLSVDIKKSAKEVHNEIKKRAVALFEPRPELNHSNNTLCIVGRRSLTKNIFLDQRAFLNSYDCKLDPDGDLLQGILNAATPVCGGINLEYYFSTVDNEKLGAGTKLPHNVVGLYSLSNGIEGDLRTGLPSQMIEVHSPKRLMMVVEHFPSVVLSTILQNKNTYEWYKNEWIKLAVIHPDTKEIFVFRSGEFEPYHPIISNIVKVDHNEKLFESSINNLPVYQI